MQHEEEVQKNHSRCTRHSIYSMEVSLYMFFIFHSSFITRGLQIIKVTQRIRGGRWTNSAQVWQTEDSLEMDSYYDWGQIYHDVSHSILQNVNRPPNQHDIFTYLHIYFHMLYFNMFCSMSIGSYWAVLGCLF